MLYIKQSSINWPIVLKKRAVFTKIEEEKGERGKEYRKKREEEEEEEVGGR